MPLYGDLIGSFVAFPVAAGFAVQLLELLVLQQTEDNSTSSSSSSSSSSYYEEEDYDCDDYYCDASTINEEEGTCSQRQQHHQQQLQLQQQQQQLYFAVGTTICFSLTAIARLLAFVYSSVNISRLSFVLGLLSVMLMNIGQWPIENVCNISPQCQGTIVTNVLANFNLHYRERLLRIWIVFVVGSYVSITNPYSNYLTDTLPTVGITSLGTSLLLILWEYIHDIRLKVKMDLVTVHGARFVLAVIFIHQTIKLMISWCSNGSNNYDSKRDIFDLMKAAVVACTGIAATGSFQSEISKKQHLECLVQQRTKEIQKQSQHLNMVNMALQASETAIAITDSSRCIIWSNSAFEEQLATTTTDTTTSTSSSSRKGSTSSSTTTTTTTGRRRSRRNNSNNNKNLLLSGMPLMDVLDFKTKEDRCYLAGAFDLSIKRTEDEICIGPNNKIFKLEVSPFGYNTTTTTGHNDNEKNDKDDDGNKKNDGTPKMEKNEQILQNHQNGNNNNTTTTTTTTTTSNNTNIRFLVVFKDMTSDRAREHAENLAKEESMMAKAMGDSMVTLTHELRTPLQGIMGITSLLLSSLSSSDNDNIGVDGGGGGSIDNSCRSIDSSSSSSSSIADSLKLIMASSSLLLNLINNLLDVKKATAKMLDDFPLASVSASNPIKDAIVFCKPLASISNVQLVTDTTLAPKAMIKSNSLRLQQVLINLVSNAIKYTERGSQITITTKQATMEDVRHQMENALASSASTSTSLPVHNQSSVASMEDDGATTPVLIFNVSDLGPGIKPDQAHRLFRQFAQLDNHQQSRTLGSNKIGQPSGTGLGLHLCQIFVQRMNGHIWATNNNDSATEGGSTFSFCLPLLSNHNTNESSFSASSAEIRNTTQRCVSQLNPRHNIYHYHHHHHQTATAEESIMERRGIPSYQDAMSYCKRLKVLFVDDTLINRKVLSRIFMKIGFAKIKTVDSGRNALIELSKEKDYDIVVTDLQMPGMSGTELSESIFHMDVASTSTALASDDSLNIIFKRPVVVGLTADTGLDVTERCQASGMSDVLYKPITVEEMKAYAETKLMYLRPGIWYEQQQDDDGGYDDDVIMNIQEEKRRGGIDEDLGTDTNNTSHPSSTSASSSSSSGATLIASRAQ